jgi:uncharacterized membrane protein HdeD (DUF308 family)
MNEWRENTLTDQIWWVFMLRGALAAALGISALIWPTLTLEILVLFVGAYLIADGVMGVVVSVRRPAASAGLLQPLVGVAVGLVLVFWPSQSARTLFMVLGAGAVFIGISKLVSARRYAVGGTDRRLMTTVGMAAGVLGVILLLWPGAAVVTVSWIIATAALLTAAVLVFLGVRIKQSKLRVGGIPPEGPTG